MKKKYFLFQLVFIISLLFAQASSHLPNNDVPVTNPNNDIEEEVFSTSNLQVLEDTYVRAGSSANDNFGSSTELFIKSSTNSDFVREALMKFDLSAYETITSAKIYFYGYAQVSMDVSVYSIDNDSWSENSVTWNNAPTFNTNIGAVALTTSYSWIELDISSAVINDFSASDKTFSIGFKDDNGIKKTIRISSKENSAQYIPYLQVEGTLAGGGGDVAVTGVSVSPTNATININNTQQLSATISPINATNQAVSWSSSNSSIASVNSTGLVTGVGIGTTTVTLTTIDGNLTSSATVTVNLPDPGTAKDVYLVIGQSNTAGRGAIEAEDMVALNGVDLFNGSSWESAINLDPLTATSDDAGLNRYSTIRNTNQPQGLNFSYTFGRTINEQTGNQIGLVVNARGGTNINDWAKGAAAGYYAAAISQINIALATPNTTLKGILWHQGESNRNDSSYLTKLSDLISDLRSDLGISGLPFIAGQLSMERTDNETFNANLETLPNIVSNTDYAESDGLGTTDLTHFDSAAQRILGERYASKMLQLVYSDANPTIICIADISQSNDAGVDGAVVTYVAPEGTDNLPGATTAQTAGLASGSLFPVGITTNTFVVTDSSGSTATCSFTITITDDENPSISCLADINQTVSPDVNGAIVTYTTPLGTDNASGVTTIQTEGLATGSLFPIGTTTNTFAATDASGNAATCSFTVTITEDVDTCNILIDENNFDSSWGIWNDGGADCRRNSNDAPFANGGTGRCVRLRDNTSTSVATTDNLDLSAFTEITVDFNYIADLMGNGEDFWLQISTNGGTSYQTVNDWVANVDFVNGTRYFESVTIQGPFSSNTRVRFRADASANADLVYIDDVKITGCSSSGATSKEISTKKEEAIVKPLEVTNKLLYTNPVENELIIESDLIIGEINIYSINGVLVRHEKINEFTGKLNVSNLQSGTYVLMLRTGNKTTTKLLVKK